MTKQYTNTREPGEFGDGVTVEKMTDEELIAALRDAADWHAGRHVAHLTTQAADRLTSLSPCVKASDILSQVALWSDDEGLDLSMGQGEDLVRRIMSAIELSASPRVETDEVDGGWLIHKAGRGWYRPNAQGYTNDTAQAGRYSHEDALSYSHPNGWDGPRDGITIKHESELQSPRTAALSSAGEKEGPEVVAFLVDCPTQPTLEFANVHVPDSAEPLVRQSALTACQQEVERLRGERKGMVHEVAYRHAVARAKAAEARNAELVKALEVSRQVLAKLLSAGYNSPSVTPEEIGAAFWSATAALGGQNNEAKG